MTHSTTAVQTRSTSTLLRIIILTVEFDYNVKFIKAWLLGTPSFQRSETFSLLHQIMFIQRSHSSRKLLGRSEHCYLDTPLALKLQETSLWWKIFAVLSDAESHSMPYFFGDNYTQWNNNMDSTKNKAQPSSPM